MYCKSVCCLSGTISYWLDTCYHFFPDSYEIYFLYTHFVSRQVVGDFVQKYALAQDIRFALGHQMVSPRERVGSGDETSVHVLID